MSTQTHLVYCHRTCLPEPPRPQGLILYAICFPSCLHFMLHQWDSRQYLPGPRSCLSFGCLHRALHSFGSKMAPSPAWVFVHYCNASACCKWLRRAQLSVIFNAVFLLKHRTLGPPVSFITLSCLHVLSNTKEKIISDPTTLKYYLSFSFMPRRRYRNIS